MRKLEAGDSDGDLQGIIARLRCIRTERRLQELDMGGFMLGNLDKPRSDIRRVAGVLEVGVVEQAQGLSVEGVFQEL